MRARELSVLKALVRPPSLLGCDRTLLILLSTACFALVGVGGVMNGKMWVVIVGVVAFLVGRQGLLELGKREPYGWQVYRRCAAHPERACARGRWDALRTRRKV